MEKIWITAVLVFGEVQNMETEQNGIVGEAVSVWWQEVYGNLVLYAQFCYEPKCVLRK